MQVFNAPEVSAPHLPGTLAAGDANPDRESLPEPYQRPMQTDFLHMPSLKPQATRRLIMPKLGWKSPYVRGWIALAIVTLIMWALVWFVPGFLILGMAIGALTWALWLVTRAPAPRPARQGTGPL